MPTRDASAKAPDPHLGLGLGNAFPLDLLTISSRHGWAGGARGHRLLFPSTSVPGSAKERTPPLHSQKSIAVVRCLLTLTQASMRISRHNTQLGPDSREERRFSDVITFFALPEEPTTLSYPLSCSTISVLRFLPVLRPSPSPSCYSPSAVSASRHLKLTVRTLIRFKKTNAGAARSSMPTQLTCDQVANPVPRDIEISQSLEGSLPHIAEVGEACGILESELEPYGRFKAKVGCVYSNTIQTC